MWISNDSHSDHMYFCSMIQINQVLLMQKNFVSSVLVLIMRCVMRRYLWQSRHWMQTGVEKSNQKNLSAGGNRQIDGHN